jgi:hypothetical protein
MLDATALRCLWKVKGYQQYRQGVVAMMQYQQSTMTVDMIAAAAVEVHAEDPIHKS